VWLFALRLYSLCVVVSMSQTVYFIAAAGKKPHRRL